MTAETPGSSTLEALRAARNSRVMFQRRMLPFLVVILAAVAYFSARQSPHLGLHGASLGLSVGLAGFVVGALGIRQTMLQRPTTARMWGPFMALLLLSSGLLLWAQPAGPGASGCIVAISAAMIARVISSRVGIALIVITIVAAAIVITQTATGQQRHQGFTGFLGAVLSFAGIFLYAMVVWRFRQHDEQSQRLLAQMEETRDAELRAAALSERQRLAREMHDVLAHSLSGLVVQLEGARLLALSDPADGRLAVTIDRAHQLARSGLDEARRAISMLRDDELPGPDKLAALARSFQADTGVPCRYTEAGDPVELRPAVRLALYRVTQEGLTNIRKHAHPERVEIRLEYLKDGVSLTMEDFAALDDKPAPASAIETSGGGYGLTGMRERAELLGGTLTAGPTSQGFLVRLRVPRVSNPGIRVLAADDQRVVREGLAMLLGLLPDVEVVGTAANGEEALALAGELRPDVILMDLRMPKMDGVEATRRLRASHPEIKVVVLTTYADDRSVIEALRAGALGYLTKDAGADEIRQALRRVADGQASLDPAVQMHLVEAIATTNDPPDPPRTSAPLLPDGLTPREAEVLGLIGAGLSNAEIASQLFVSEATVKSHVNHMLPKIGARDRAQAVGYAYRHGLVPPGSVRR